MADRARAPRAVAGILSRVVSLVLAALLVAAQETPAHAAELPPEKVSALQAALEELQERFHIPGMSAALVHRRAVAWSKGFGFADLEHDVWAEPDTRYRIASVSKPFAAVLLLQLVEQGKLSLDAPMKDFDVPLWFAPDPVRYREQPVLVRHVLTHTSEGTPGERYAYNGNAYADLTWVVEGVTRTAYSRLLQQRVFDPLRMTDSVPGHVRIGARSPVEMARPIGGRAPSSCPRPTRSSIGIRSSTSRASTRSCACPGRRSRCARSSWAKGSCTGTASAPRTGSSPRSSISRSSTPPSTRSA
jgi:CubicO group peptidase (beta-lactamase class C family)